MKRVAFGILVAVLTAFILQSGLVPGVARAQVIITADIVAAGCPDKAWVDAIRADLPGGLNFSTDPTVGQAGGCAADTSHYALTRLQRKVYQSLGIMKWFMPFDTPLPWISTWPIPWNDSSLWLWFRSSVKGIAFTSESLSWCCDAQGLIHVHWPARARGTARQRPRTQLRHG